MDSALRRGEGSGGEASGGCPDRPWADGGQFALTVERFEAGVHGYAPRIGGLQPFGLTAEPVLAASRYKHKYLGVSAPNLPTIGGLWGWSQRRSLPRRSSTEGFGHGASPRLS